MLLYLFRYNAAVFFNRGINLKNNSVLKQHPPKTTKIQICSAFLTPQYMRTLLQYLNLLNCNYFLSPDQNYFNLQTIAMLFYSRIHPGYYHYHVYLR